jgi:hypothetical protein
MNVKGLHAVRVANKVIITGEYVPDDGWLAFPTFSVVIEGCGAERIQEVLTNAFTIVDEAKPDRKFKA